MVIVNVRYSVSYSSTLWTNKLCFFNESLHLNILPQNEHSKVGGKLEHDKKCLVKCALCLKAFEHWMHICWGATPHSFLKCLIRLCRSL